MAYVWAIRSAEIFFKEALLVPIYFEQSGDPSRALRKAARVFGSGKWDLALGAVVQAYGLAGEHHEMLTTDGGDAWSNWLKVGVRQRGDVVHGRAEASAGQAESAIAFADQLRSWFTIRIVSSDDGPLAGTLQELIRGAQQALAEQGLVENETGPIPPSDPGPD